MIGSLRKMLGQSIVGRIVFRLLLFVVFVLITGGDVYGSEYLVDVTKFGTVADAKKVDGVWVGTDNSKAMNACAAYCRANGLTMFFPKGNYGVASTIWLTNPALDGHEQASITVIGPNRGAYADQSDGAKICILKTFTAGKMLDIKKANGVTVREPDIVPVLGISNCRQVHLQGITVQGNNRTDLISGITLGNRSSMASIENCSVHNTYTGIVITGLRNSPTESIIEGDNDLLVVSQCSLYNAYNIICAGTQPFACEYRNSSFLCSRSVFTGTLLTDYWGQTTGSHRFCSNEFQSSGDATNEDIVYFDLQYNEVTIDSCHFETSSERNVPEILIRQVPLGGVSHRYDRVALTNSRVNFRFVNKNPVKYRPLIDTMTGNRMIIEGNTFYIGTATRIKAYGAIFIGNVFLLSGPYNLDVVNDVHILKGSAGNIEAGMYDFNHHIRKDSPVKIRFPDGTVLKENTDYEVVKGENAFKITKQGKTIIDEAKAEKILISYSANDAAQIRFDAWGGNTFNPPHGWWCQDLTMIANKIIGKVDSGQLYEGELHTKYELPINK